MCVSASIRLGQGKIVQILGGSDTQRSSIMRRLLPFLGVLDCLNDNEKSASS